METGKFIISLDFELHWGAPEIWELSAKRNCFDETRKSIPKVLALFKEYNIHATWATVGFLFAKSKAQAEAFFPLKKPSYSNQHLNYYNLFAQGLVGENEDDDPYHFAPSLIQEIIDTPGQEMATHTFSHYYCNENGQSIEEFELDLKAAQNIAKENFQIELQSIVFPRNQFNEKYITVAKKNGIKVVRSNPDVWFWKSNSKIVPLFRALDTLMPISVSLTFDSVSSKDGVLLLPASRFLRPYIAKEKAIQNLKIARIKNEMSFAARNNKSYHLWWHPHNFGDNPQENMQILEDIVKHFKKLNAEFGFESKTMLEMSNLIS